MLIDATLKAPRRRSRCRRASSWRSAKAIWDELKLPALTPQPPWHGYSLGDWADDWETFARRAVKGEWEASGKETFARRRGGVTPETPVRDVEGKKK